MTNSIQIPGDSVPPPEIAQDAAETDPWLRIRGSRGSFAA